MQGVGAGLLGEEPSPLVLRTTFPSKDVLAEHRRVRLGINVSTLH